MDVFYDSIAIPILAAIAGAVVTVLLGALLRGSEPRSLLTPAIGGAILFVTLWFGYTALDHVGAAPAAPPQFLILLTDGSRFPAESVQLENDVLKLRLATVPEPESPTIDVELVRGIVFPGGQTSARREWLKRLLEDQHFRDDVVIHEGELSTLKRFKDEVREVQVGQECGMGFTNYQDLQKGDVIECFEVETIQRAL